LLKVAKCVAFIPLQVKPNRRNKKNCWCIVAMWILWM